MEVCSSSPFRLGPWIVDLSGSELIDETGRAVPLDPKLAELLGLLVEKGEHGVPRKVLLSSLWPGMSVGTVALDNAVAELQRVLGDNPDSPQFIEVEPPSGYRLIQHPQPIAKDSAGRESPWVTSVALCGALLAASMAIEFSGS